MKKLIIFLIRKKLGLKKRERFQFVNQKSNAVYYFTNTEVRKIFLGEDYPSSVSINWLLSAECEIIVEEDSDLWLV